MKKIFLNTVFFFSFVSVYPQVISVELSIEWKKEDILLPDTFLNGSNKSCVPYLNITYRNNSDSAIYFLKVSASNKGIPPIVSLIFTSSENNVRPPLSFSNYSGKDYYVYIGNSPNCFNLWEVASDTCTLSQDYGEEMINAELNDIYENLAKQLRVDIGYDFDSCPSKMDDMEEDMLIKMYKDNFIFLKSGETFTEHYNLTGFYLLGGNFEFSIHPNFFYDYMYGEGTWNADQKKWILNKLALPKHLNGYNLYSGMFLSNKVSIKIKHPL